MGMHQLKPLGSSLLLDREKYCLHVLHSGVVGGLLQPPPQALERWVKPLLS